MIATAGIPVNVHPGTLIDWFDDFAGPNQYAFLSNFYEADVVWRGVRFPTSEHAFAWAKTTDPGWRYEIHTAATPGEAKSLGRACPLRPDWEVAKFGVMRDIVWEKFAQWPGLRLLLLQTGNAYLQEGTVWNDRVWGVDLNSHDDPWQRVGNNWLGLILMDTRHRLRRAA